ncbi:hypothetical protein [Aeromicrobium chenweiae]|uniref:Uncharacterized protein n=1 Tax=Aeromicrobium chenweiae TaxID=2079793 RepID=A0A2S0WR54_9ACTN|nr:hypothetical protein [Aeromicrobium chenweiae]AWB93792.1 hypothetical protein C3E78_17115 [Aeromicrobium chenweiae]TGN30837.1 hypothetical protein E4L97_14530 [Aeromicrobium chenweiae]
MAAVLLVAITAFLAGAVLLDWDDRVQGVVADAAERSSVRALVALGVWFLVTCAGLAIAAIVMRAAADLGPVTGVAAMAVTLFAFGGAGVSFTLTRGGGVSPSPAEFRRGRRIGVGASRLVTIAGGFLGLVLVALVVGAVTYSLTPL